MPGWLDSKFSYSAIPSMFFIIPNICSMNLYVTKRLLRSFDFYLFLAYLSCFTFSVVTSIPDERKVSLICGYCLGVYLLCTDALPEPVRIKTLRFGVPLFALAVLFICCIIYAGRFHNLEVWHISFNGTQYNSGMVAMSAGGNFLVFNTKVRKRRRRGRGLSQQQSGPAMSESAFAHPRTPPPPHPPFLPPTVYLPRHQEPPPF